MATLVECTLCSAFVLNLHSFSCYLNDAIAIFGGFFLPGLICVSANAVLFFFITTEIHETLSQAPQSDRREKSKEFKVYWSIFISIGLSWIAGFLMMLFKKVTVMMLLFLTIFSLTTPLQGIQIQIDILTHKIGGFIFTAYCLNAKVFGRWAGVFGKVLPFCRQWEHMGSSRSTGASTRS